MNGICDGDRKTFTTDKEGLPLPNRQLLGLHNAVCKVVAAYFGDEFGLEHHEDEDEDEDEDEYEDEDEDE
jgi:hypothetical protein